ncbi:hypothetical protein [Clostridium sporogenes]|uniref:hypothetical protein n=1 Tax=Clostridium sporogenes TaxID=1509 RepID=UPI002237E987|nr:hypothetical protein [Clostridium sporogenes]MCW6088837.1 hypothetical protein [Clostridium sporogenes]
MERIKQLGLIISSISAVLTIIVLIIKFFLNVPYKLIEKSLGIKKNDKEESIVFFILIIILFLIPLFGFYIGLSNKHSIKDSTSNQYPVIVLIHLAVTGILWVIYFNKNKYFNKNILKYINSTDSKMRKKYINWPTLQLLFIIIINAFVVVKYFKMYKIDYINIGCLTTSIIISFLLVIMMYSTFELKLKLMSLKNKTVYTKGSKAPIRGCKIIYVNDKYTCVYNDSKIIYINNCEIVKIESYSL